MIVKPRILWVLEQMLSTFYLNHKQNLRKLPRYLKVLHLLIDFPIIGNSGAVQNVRLLAMFTDAAFGRQLHQQC